MQPNKFATLLVTGSVIAIILISIAFSNYPIQDRDENPLDNEKPKEDSQNSREASNNETAEDDETPVNNETDDEITIVSWETGWELITCLPRPTGETNYDFDGFLNVTVNNPTDQRCRMRLTVRYDYAFNYTLWGETQTAQNSHKTTVTKTIYEQWQRPYKFGLFYRPFDADNPANLHVIRFNADILEISVVPLN